MVCETCWNDDPIVGAFHGCPECSKKNAAKPVEVKCDNCGDEPSHWEDLSGEPCGRDLSEEVGFSRDGACFCTGHYRPIGEVGRDFNPPIEEIARRFEGVVTERNPS